MKRVTGLGGVFFKCEDSAGMRKWYADHLGLDGNEYGYTFIWRKDDDPQERAYSQWSPFKKETEYFGPSEKPYMFNYRVDDLTKLIPVLKEEGVRVVGEIEQHENGKFAWIMDPEGNKIELWEPVAAKDDPYMPKD